VEFTYNMAIKILKRMKKIATPKMKLNITTYNKNFKIFIFQFFSVFFLFLLYVKIIINNKLNSNNI
jgi:hypothetical protein